VKLGNIGLGTRFLNAVGLAPIGQVKDAFTEARNLNDPTVPISSTEVLKLFGIESTDSGEKVSYDLALTLSAVYRANKIICDTIASVPLNIYEKSGNSKAIAVDHDYQYLLHSEPNPMHTSFNWRHAGQTCYNFNGNDYSLKTKHKGAPVILPLLPEQVIEVKKAKNGFDLIYKIEALGKTRLYSQNEVIHVKNQSRTGLTGKGYLTVAAQTFGSGLAQRNYGSRFWKNNASSGLILMNKIIGRGGEAAKKQNDDNIRQWNQSRTGQNQHGTAVLTGEWDVKNITVPQDQAQFIETANLSIGDIGRFFGVPPHLLYDMSRSTFNNIEHQSIEFVTHSILGIITNRQQELDRKLFGGKENKGKYSARFNLNGLLQSDIKSRSEFYQMAVNNAVMNPDEIRAKEDMNNIPEWNDSMTPGQRFRVQQSYMPLDKMGDVLNKEKGNGEESV
jgi:HK97 family phage portal protein